MRSLKRRAHLTPLILALSLPLTGGCVATRLSAPILSALSCADLIPPSYRQPVPIQAALPTSATVGDLANSLDKTVSALDQANGRSSDLVAIADTCQARQRAVLEALSPTPWYQRALAPILKPQAAK